MLFNSYEFIFFFLPTTLLIFFYIGQKFSGRIALASLVTASLFFYAWWNAIYVALLIASILANYGIGTLMGEHGPRKKTFLTTGIIFNLSLLGYFKYANFFIENASFVFGGEASVTPIILPLAISFFTFQQIAYLVDVYKGKTPGYSIIEYTLFVAFFPQLIAGPIVHHKQVMPQFLKQSFAKVNTANFAMGSSVFAIGLFKKVVLADGIAIYANTAFSNAANGVSLDFLAAWGGALSYTFQLYFDFSGYSDMAIGIALLFGIQLPVNFYSPYKARSIVDFWRRWHITLSSFLRDYVYIPLGGNRSGQHRRYINLFATMVLGGLWHGAAWTFVFWGALHGTYLMINHCWRWAVSYTAIVKLTPQFIGNFLSWALTFIAVVLGWVFFRAETFETAITVIEGMTGNNGLAIPQALARNLAYLIPAFQEVFNVDIYLGGGSNFLYMWMWIIILAIIAFFASNTVQLMAKYSDAFANIITSLDGKKPGTKEYFTTMRWKPNTIWALSIGIAFAVAILNLNSASEFLYFQF
ncbi:MBOAT family O-acyltransferase [Kordiimonas aquimaris]|uniref:MBOAT family O-acyltransferase n=1 Tax=Kordiimonas aquimaris TaxID=707591 RepID=UPI0021CFB6E6|nr:MBOAT family protein [Kordiimonas aquimaris]